jgi:hypothetical protein
MRRQETERHGAARRVSVLVPHGLGNQCQWGALPAPAGAWRTAHNPGVDVLSDKE